MSASDWPEFENERLTGALLRVDLYEHRYLAVLEFHNVMNHLLRSASAACLADREEEGTRLIDRAAQRMGEWTVAVRDGRVRPASYADFAATRGLLALVLWRQGHEAAAAVAREFVRQTAEAPAGSVHNARLAALVLLDDAEGAQASARLCELSDPGLGLPWKRFVLALLAHDEPGMHKALDMWVNEKMEATLTHEWGAYNEVPIEVSGALGLAEAAGVPLRLESTRVLTRFRA